MQTPPLPEAPKGNGRPDQGTGRKSRTASVHRLEAESDRRASQDSRQLHPKVHSRPQSDDLPVGADAALLQVLGEFQGSVGKTLTSISERLEAVAVLASHRSTRKGSGTSPSRPRRMNAQEAGGRAPAGSIAEGASSAGQDASLQRQPVEGLNTYALTAWSSSWGKRATRGERGYPRRSCSSSGAAAFL